MKGLNMKLSQTTINVLKNFSVINQSIILKPGNVIRTISPQKTVVAIANVEENFPRELGIYNISQFLATLSMYESPELEFGEKVLTFSQGKSVSTMTYSDPSMIIAPPSKDFNLPSIDVSVKVSADELTNVLKAANVLGLPEIAFVGENGVCYLKAIDSSNPSANSHKIEVGETADNFTLIIKTSNINLLSSDYSVELSSKGISKFVGKNVTYFIAIESKSTYSKGA
jgi:hypothetical protein